MKTSTVVRHYQPHIPPAVIIVPAGEYPELRLKAWTGRVISAFVAVALQDVSNRFVDTERPSQLALATMAAVKLAEWLLMIERYPRFLSQQQAEHLYRIAWEFLFVKISK